MTDLEKLSALLAGDLDAAEARVLRDRLTQEPTLARQWSAMQDLGAALGSLVEVPVPAGLDAAVRGEPVARRSRWLVVPWVAAAAALLVAFLSSRDDRVQVRLLEGSQRVEGHVHALAGAVEVEVDGIAVITVEPSPPLSREWSAQEDPMSKTAVLSALAAATVTIAVYEGTARLYASEGADAPVVVQAGETLSVGYPTHAPIAAARLVLSEPPSDGTPAQQIAHLAAENQSLREALAASEFEGAINRGQLSAHQGDPVAWPETIPEGFAPEEFEATLKKALEAHPGITLAALDCGEFPCVAVLGTDDLSEGWEQRIAGIPQDLEEGAFGDESVGAQVMIAKTDDGEGEHGAAGLAFVPAGADGELDPAIETRTGHRTRELLEAFDQP